MLTRHENRGGGIDVTMELRTQLRTKREVRIYSSSNCSYLTSHENCALLTRHENRGGGIDVTMELKTQLRTQRGFTAAAAPCALVRRCALSVLINTVVDRSLVLILFCS